MFLSLCDACEPGPLLLSRLLRAEDEPTGTLFGDDVGGVEEVAADDTPAWLTEAAKQVDINAVRVQDLRPVPSLKGQLLEWLIDTLGNKRGVLAALPGSTVMAVNPKAAAGHGWWWLWNLRRTLFSKRDSHSPRALVTVYRLGGGPERGFDWFPRGVSYGLKPGLLDGFLHFGLTVSVREFVPSSREPGLPAQVQYAAAVAHLALEAAALGVAPAVLAATLVFDKDGYASAADRMLPSDAAVTSELSVASKESRRVVALVQVTQLHTFTLGDMLMAYDGMGPDENVVLAKSTIQSAVADLCGKIKMLADSKVLKLSVTLDTVLFCPVLEDSVGGDDWALRGFSFRARGFDPIEGLPFLSDFDPRLCKHMDDKAGYYSQCAYVFMVSVLLASVRAQVPGAYAAVLEAVVTPEFQGAWSGAKDKLDAYTQAFSAVFTHTRIERDPMPRSVFDEAIDDLVFLLGAGPGALVDMASEDAMRPLFQRLLKRLLNTRSHSVSEVLTEDERAADRAVRRKESARLEAVMQARHKRLLARRGAAVL